MTGEGRPGERPQQTSHPSIPLVMGLAREVCSQPEPVPAGDLLEAWALGFCAGHDQASAPDLLRYAEDIADIDRAELIEIGQLSRERRIGREIAAMEKLAVMVRQTDDWPTVTMPGRGQSGE